MQSCWQGIRRWHLQACMQDQTLCLWCMHCHMPRVCPLSALSTQHLPSSGKQAAYICDMHMNFLLRGLHSLRHVARGFQGSKYPPVAALPIPFPCGRLDALANQCETWPHALAEAVYVPLLGGRVLSPEFPQLNGNTLDEAKALLADFHSSWQQAGAACGTPWWCTLLHVTACMS